MRSRWELGLPEDQNGAAFEKRGLQELLSVGKVSPLLNSSRWPIANWRDRWRTTAVGGAWHQKAAPERKSSQSDSKWKDSNHSDQACQAQYLDTVDEVFGRMLLRATFAGRCCCWWSNYLFRWLKTQKTPNVNYTWVGHQKDKEKDKYAVLRFSGINALTPMSCKQNSKALPVTSLPFCHCRSRFFNSAFTFMSWPLCKW